MFRDRRRGYNFLEIMVTSLIFSTIMLSLMSVWITHARSVAKARTRMAGNFLAERQMEECLARGFFGVDGMDNTGDPDTDKELYMKTTLRGYENTFIYHYHIKVTDLDPDRKSIEVRVTWTESNELREVRIESLLSRAG